MPGTPPGVCERCSRLRKTHLAHLPEADDDYVALCPKATQLERAVYLIELLDHHYPGDPGMLVALCMNMVHLYPGQAMHTPPQQLHRLYVRYGGGNHGLLGQRAARG